MFLAAVVVSVGLSTCGDDTTSGPDPMSGFDFSRDLIAFRSERDGQQEIYLITADGAELINITPTTTTILPGLPTARESLLAPTGKASSISSS